MNTLLLGARGKLGGVLRRHAQRAGRAWQTQARSGPADILWPGTMTDPQTDKVFQPGSTLINMIGYTGQDSDLLQACNVQLVQDILTRARDAGVAHVVLASSAAVYGAAGPDPIAEDTPLRPLSPYGESKAAMEESAQTLMSGRDNPALTILRIGNVAGADALTAAALRQRAARQPVHLDRFEDGTAPVRSYIGPRDLYRVVDVLSAPHDDHIRILNVTAPQAVSFDAVLAGYRTHVMPDLTWVDAPAPETVPKRVILSAQKLQDFVKFDEYTDYADAMAQQVAEDIAD